MFVSYHTALRCFASRARSYVDSVLVRFFMDNIKDARSGALRYTRLFLVDSLGIH